MNFIVGIIVGIIISTIGFGGVARVLDHGVVTVKKLSREIPVDKD